WVPTLVGPVIRALRRHGLARHPRFLHGRRARRRVSDPVLGRALLCAGSAAAGIADRHPPLRARHPPSRGALRLAPVARVVVGRSALPARLAPAGAERPRVIPPGAAGSGSVRAASRSGSMKSLSWPDA